MSAEKTEQAQNAFNQKMTPEQCRQILEWTARIKQANPNWTWQQIYEHMLAQDKQAGSQIQTILDAMMENLTDEQWNASERVRTAWREEEDNNQK